jgi:hypothetical protein
VSPSVRLDAQEAGAAEVTDTEFPRPHLFVLFQPSIDCMMAVHTDGSDILYSVHLFQKQGHRHTGSYILPAICTPLSPLSFS